ncbi:GNAT family N-acetyltransferase [Flavobacterium sp. CYK-4]|uniref:GNAT family N-acetyltransferase n=1 Tax=Flavobacterium lotistagni TaxID=2709660 RepID=UPI0014081FF6|nr:GNAT family N-acetyltransferase [Flavobacterium lotistagni]NHM06009.1 GNAT family N-acetyltransferase [Flavobacterium lotistagni]
MNKKFETERLILREFTLEDAEFVLKLLNSKGWLRFIGERNVKTIADAQNYLANGPMQHYQKHGFGLWLVLLKDTTPIGMCGILKRDSLDLPDLGFCLLPEYHAKGFAYESAKAAMDVGQTFFGIEKFCAITLPENHASIRLLEKLGFVLAKAIQFPDSNEVLSLYHN